MRSPLSLVYLALAISAPADAAYYINYRFQLKHDYCSKLEIIGAQIKGLSQTILTISQEEIIALQNNDETRQMELRELEKLQRAKLRGKQILNEVLQLQPVNFEDNEFPSPDVVEQMLLRMTLSGAEDSFWDTNKVSYEEVFSPLPIKVYRKRSGTTDLDIDIPMAMEAPDYMAWNISNGYPTSKIPINIYFKVHEKPVWCIGECSVSFKNPVLKVSGLAKDICSANSASDGVLAKIRVAIENQGLDEKAYVTYSWELRNRPFESTLSDSATRVFDAAINDFLVDVLGERQTYKVTDTITKKLDPGVLTTTWEVVSEKEFTGFNGQKFKLGKITLPPPPPSQYTENSYLNNLINGKKSVALLPSPIKSESLRSALDRLNYELAQRKILFSDSELIAALQKKGHFTAYPTSSRDVAAVEFSIEKDHAKVRIGFVVLDPDRPMNDGESFDFVRFFKLSAIKVGYVLLDNKPYFYSPYMRENGITAELAEPETSGADLLKNL